MIASSASLSASIVVGYLMTTTMSAQLSHLQRFRPIKPSGEPAISRRSVMLSRISRRISIVRSVDIDLSSHHPS
ncbi:MAG: hypothetical protein C1943_15195 [Halochromatium sp.]|nr:hypothetical protein [Halochromatium sp.]